MVVAPVSPPGSCANEVADASRGRFSKSSTELTLVPISIWSSPSLSVIEPAGRIKPLALRASVIEV